MDHIVALSNALLAILWAVWLIGWTGAAFFVKRTRRRERLAAVLLERVPIMAGAVLLAAPHATRRMPVMLTQRLFAEDAGVAIGGLILVVVGLWFATWARVHLGRNWSGEVMVKVGHSLITSGPYRWVRHPIYAGLILALIGTALMLGAPYAFLGLALILFGFLVRVHLEEAMMRETFPVEYDAYSRHTARLIPHLY